MNQDKPKDTLDGEKCPICSDGRLQLCQVDHQVQAQDEDEFIVSQVWVEKCSSCGEILFPFETSRYIEQVISERTEQLTSSQLEQIRRDLGVDQTEMSEILGLGGRTYHRWEKGSQYPSRSMCFYIRVLFEFPDAFYWLRQRGWRHGKRVLRFHTSAELAEMFPDLANDPECESAIKAGFNPACGLSRVAFGSL